MGAGTVDEGDALPALELVTPDGGRLALRSCVGRPLALYFYPKSDTAGCTREAQDFSRLRPDFDALGIELLGVSRDPPARLRRFIDKYGLIVPLASDGGEDGDPAATGATAAFGVWAEKQLYGKRYWGIERATFLFDADGRLARSWRKVRVPGHADAVLAAARALR